MKWSMVGANPNCFQLIHGRRHRRMMMAGLRRYSNGNCLTNLMGRTAVIPCWRFKCRAHPTEIFFDSKSICFRFHTLLGLLFFTLKHIDWHKSRRRKCHTQEMNVRIESGKGEDSTGNNTLSTIIQFVHFVFRIFLYSVAAKYCALLVDDSHTFR